MWQDDECKNVPNNVHGRNCVRFSDGVEEGPGLFAKAGQLAAHKL